MKLKEIVFSCGNLKLKGMLHLPDGSRKHPGVVICHPHPLYGGDMDNPVVVAACDNLVANSITVLRFNFRGVGGSEGSHGGGIAEREDARAALDYLASLENIDTQRIGLAGYSFGSRVALAVAMGDERVNQLALISPSLGADGVEQLKRCTIPCFIIMGNMDTMVPKLDFTGLPKTIQHKVITGADHFWRGHEDEVGRHVAGFLLGLTHSSV